MTSEEQETRAEQIGAILAAVIDAKACSTPDEHSRFYLNLGRLTGVVMMLEHQLALASAERDSYAAALREVAPAVRRQMDDAVREQRRQLEVEL